MEKKKTSPNKSRIKNNQVLGYISKIYLILTRNARVVSLTTGSLVVAVWTIYRHITNGVNYDVVGQIGLAQQWSDGMLGGSQLGITNYLIKMPLYFVINSVDVLSPMNRLLILALILNLATFTLLFVLFEKILKLSSIKDHSWLYLSFVWLATIAGDVFWVDYANSRNIEVVGGILIFYLWLKYLNRQHWRLLIPILIVCSITFFADNLMFYVCGIGVCFYASLRLLAERTKQNLTLLFNIVLLTSAGYLMAKLLFILFAKILPITFLSSQMNKPELTIPYGLNAAKQTAINTFNIFGANFLQQPFTFNNLRQFLNALILFSVILLLVKLFTEIKSIVAVQLAVTLISVNYLAYAVSGQTVQWATSRYLIMVPLLLVIIAGIGCTSIRNPVSINIKKAWIIILVINIIFITGALAINWPSRHTKDANIYNLITFMENRHYKYAISSRQNGIVATYVSDQDIKVLPFGCIGGKISPTNLFYDNSVFSQLHNYSADIPIILPAGAINFGEKCRRTDIITQFGEPIQEQNIEGVGSVLVYPGKVLHFN